MYTQRVTTLMFAELKTLGRETLLYGLSSVAGRMVNLLLLPVYTNFLSPEEYGQVAIAYAYIAGLNVLYGYGMDAAYMKHRSFSAAYLPVAATSLLLSGVLLHNSVAVAEAVGLGGFSGPDVVRYGAGILALDALTLIPFAALRMSHRASGYVAVRLAGLAANVALAILFVSRMDLGVRGVFLANLCASGLTVGLLLPTLAREARLPPQWGRLPDLLRFALPLVPAGLASMVIQVADRPILQRLTDDATVGIYQANYRLGVFMMLVVGMFDLAWRPFFLERESRPREETGPILARVLTYFLVGAGGVFLAVTLFVEDLVALRLFGVELVHPSYWEGLPLVPIILGAYLVNGVYVNFMAQVYFTRRTSLAAYASGLGAAVSLGANFALIPAWGMYGAAWAHVLAYLAMAGYLFRRTQRLDPLPYEYGRLAKLGAVLFALTLAYFGLLSQRSFMEAPEALLAKLVLLAGFPVCLYASGFFTSEERRALARLWSRLRP